MASRLELQTKLEELLGSEYVYYQPPATVKMSYTAIRFSKKDIEKDYANNKAYRLLTSYEVIVISPMPDDPVIAKILELPHTSFDRHYKADNLNHDVITIYW